jgi:NADH:ubiquinone oxidoreductase subunit C
VEKNEIEIKANELLKKSIIEKQKLGRSTTSVLWFENKTIVEAASTLANDEVLQLNSLDFLTAMEAEGAVVLSYFLVSSNRKTLDLVLRTSISQKKHESKKVQMPSVTSVWPEARIFEKELSEVFGIEFVGGRGLS